MSKFKAEFTLKQHTPIIHFQSEQSGATLRATELKPKFDRFLKQYAFGDEVPREFLIDEDKDALDYKVNIKSNNVKVEDFKNKTYFGNMGKDKDDKEYRKTTIIINTFKIEFFSFKLDLLEKIKQLFSSFLARTNFGTRQNKGFGSFYIDKSDDKFISPKEALDKIKSVYIYAIYKNENSEKVFSHVEVIYPLIKTGINYPDYPKKDHPRGYTDKNGKIKQVPDPEAGRGKRASYYKSYLFQYMLNQNPPIGNEKRFIKENFFRPNLQTDSDNITKKYVRALLGISDGIEFKDHERKGEIEYSNSKIERFKSPLTFKVIENQLFIISEGINSEIYDKSFSFSNTFKRQGKNTTVTRDIFIPSCTEFNLEDFLFSCADYFNDQLAVKKNNKNIFDNKIEQAQKAKFIKASL